MWYLPGVCNAFSWSFAVFTFCETLLVDLIRVFMPFRFNKHADLLVRSCKIMAHVTFIIRNKQLADGLKTVKCGRSKSYKHHDCANAVVTNKVLLCSFLRYKFVHIKLVYPIPSRQTLICLFARLLPVATNQN